MPRRHRLVLGVASVLLALNLAWGIHVHSAISRAAGEAKGYTAMRQFAGVLRLIRTNYVDQEKTDYQDLIHGALRGMLGSLDRFSSFIPPHDFGRMREETEGEFGGIGVVVSIKDDALTVVAPMEGSPGMRAGLRPNDRIVEINGEDSVSMALDESVDLIKGEPGTTVELTIYRPGTKGTFTVTIERAVIEIDTVKDASVQPDGIAYVRLTQFNDKSAAKLEEALSTLQQDGMTALTLDLRNNPGGLLNSAIDVCSLFLPARQLIVSTEGRDEDQKQEFLSLPGIKYVDMPMCILVNEGSASAAEIVAGCLQDSKRAQLVGETSFGKGSVQSIIELADGSAVRLTTAYYYTPSRRVIHEHGVEPDVVVDISDEDSQQLYFQRSRVPAAPHLDGEPADIPDRQLDKAVELLRAQLAEPNP